MMSKNLYTYLFVMFSYILNFIHPFKTAVFSNRTSRPLFDGHWHRLLGDFEGLYLGDDRWSAWSGKRKRCLRRGLSEKKRHEGDFE